MRGGDPSPDVPITAGEVDVLLGLIEEAGGRADMARFQRRSPRSRARRALEYAISEGYITEHGFLTEKAHVRIACEEAGLEEEFKVRAPDADTG